MDRRHLGEAQILLQQGHDVRVDLLPKILVAQVRLLLIRELGVDAAAHRAAVVGAGLVDVGQESARCHVVGQQVRQSASAGFLVRRAEGVHRLAPDDLDQEDAQGEQGRVADDGGRRHGAILCAAAAASHDESMSVVWAVTPHCEEDVAAA